MKNCRNAALTYRSKETPTNAVTTPSATRATIVPAIADFQPRVMPMARMMVKASTTSTADAMNTAAISPTPSAVIIAVSLSDLPLAPQKLGLIVTKSPVGEIADVSTSAGIRVSGLRRPLCPSFGDFLQHQYRLWLKRRNAATSFWMTAWWEEADSGSLDRRLYQRSL